MCLVKYPSDGRTSLSLRNSFTRVITTREAASDRLHRNSTASRFQLRSQKVRSYTSGSTIKEHTAYSRSIRERFIPGVRVSLLRVRVAHDRPRQSTVGTLSVSRPHKMQYGGLTNNIVSRFQIGARAFYRRRSSVIHSLPVGAVHRWC